MARRRLQSLELSEHSERDRERVQLGGEGGCTTERSGPHTTCHNENRQTDTDKQMAQIAPGIYLPIAVRPTIRLVCLVVMHGRPNKGCTVPGTWYDIRDHTTHTTVYTNWLCRCDPYFTSILTSLVQCTKTHFFVCYPSDNQCALCINMQQRVSYLRIVVRVSQGGA